MKDPTLNSIPRGLCHCGCGQQTTYHKYDKSPTRPAGYAKYVHGHNTRGKNKIVTNYFVNKQGCWIWLGAVTAAGYGLFSIDNKLVYVHRYMYEQKYGKVPEDLVLDHFACNNPRCINADHLKPVTRSENSSRQYTKDPK